MKYYFIVTASGIGKRMGLDYAKQFHEINGVPIFIKTLQIIDKIDTIDGIIMTTSKENRKLMEMYLHKFMIKKIIGIVDGGSERQYSIYAALQYLKKEHLNQNSLNNVIIGVQDAVRPNIKSDYITEPYNELQKNSSIDGIVVGTLSKDTTKIIDANDCIVSTTNRKFTFQAHTPQIFRGDTLFHAYEVAHQTSFLGTDDASLVENIHGKIKIFLGAYDNIKITTPEDLKFFEL